MTTPLSPEKQKHVDSKYFADPLYKMDYFFSPLGMTKDGARVLDVGCGSGQHLHLFSPESVGITFTNDAVIEYVTEKYKLNLRKFNLDEEWPDDLGEFDVVFTSDSIIHLSSPTKLLLEMRYRMKDDGRILLMIPQSSPFFSADKSILHPYTFNRRTMMHVFEMTGFEIEKTSGFIRRLPDWVNRLVEPFTKRWGPNLWIVAKKKKDFAIAEGNIRPKWIKSEIWPQ